METRTPSKTIVFPHCVKCGNQTRFLTNVLDPLSGKTIRIYECDCGDKTWITDE